jgi:hypothetical protein
VDFVLNKDHIDSPPVPVAVGSPVCARKSFDTISKVISTLRGYTLEERRTIKKCIKVIEVHLTQLQKVFTCFGAGVDFEIDDYVAEGSFQKNRHRSPDCLDSSKVGCQVSRLWQLD